MNEPQDDGVPRDARDELGPIGSLTIERLIRVARFPIYGLIGYPGGLTLRGIGYCSAHPQAFRADAQPGLPHVLYQVSLSYEYPPPHRRAGQSMELFTTDINCSPIPAPPIEAPPIEAQEHAGAARYPAPRDIPPEAPQAADFVIERFPLLDGAAVATIRCSPQYPPRPLATGPLLGRQVHHLLAPSAPGSPSPRPTWQTNPVPAVPLWSFTLRGPELWVEGHASGWTRDELLAALGQVGVVSHRPEVLAQYQRELTAWKRHLGFDEPLA